MKPLEIALLWHTFGHGNLGVDALARGNANVIRAAAAAVGVPVRFTSLGSGQNYAAPDLPGDVTIGPAPRLKPLLRGRSEFLDVVRRSDLVFDIGEGDSFTDLYGGRRYSFLLGTKIAVLAARRALVIAPQTIGPFDNAARRWLAAEVLRRARAVFTRDGLSTDFLRDNGVFGNTDEFIDVAFALPFTRQEKARGRVRVGLNVSGLLYNGGYSGRNELGLRIDYAGLMHGLIEGLLARDNVETHLFVHVSGNGGPDDDLPVARQLARRYPGLVMAPGFGTAEQAKSYISGMDYVVAGRMHAAIAAFSAGVPVMPIAYSRKFNGLFGTLGYPHFVDGKVISTDAALAALVDGFERRAELQLAVESGLVIARQRLAAYQAAVAGLLEERVTTRPSSR
jgi:polysaccharide pyruvyl transferase WcaK-like protein